MAGLKGAEGLVDGYLTHDGVGFADNLSEAGLFCEREELWGRSSKEATAELDKVLNDPDIRRLRKLNQIVSPTSLRQVGHRVEAVELVKLGCKKQLRIHKYNY